LKSPRIVQEGVDQAMTLSLVACRIAFKFAADEARWQCPRRVTFLPVVDLEVRHLLDIAGVSSPIFAE
jgi:hypothetical protein